MIKLEHHHRHILKLMARDAGEDEWVQISEKLFPVVSRDFPPELAEFEKLDTGGGRARLTNEGKNLISAMEWL